MKRYDNRYVAVQLGVVATALVCVFVLCTAQSFAQGCDDTPDHFTFTANTGDNYAIVVDSTSLDCDLSDCDEIGVFDGDLCVGASVFRGQWPLGITAWKDDTQTGDVDGYVSGNPMTFKIWYSTSDSEIENFDVIYESGNGTFDSGPFARLSLLCCNPPPPPTSFSAYNGCNSVTYSWGAVAGADGYCVYINGDSVWCGTETSHQFNDLEPVVQMFRVASYNECGLGELSTGLGKTPLAIPDVPSWWSASSDRCGYISITWENVDRDGGYLIYRDGGNEPIDTTGHDITSYVDSVTGLHEYSVSAFNYTCGESEKSEIATGTGRTTPSAVQPVMSPLVNKISIDWPVEASASTYELEVITPASMGDTAISMSDIGLVFTLPTDLDGLALSGLYWVELTCLNDCGRSNTLVDSVELFHIGGQVVDRAQDDTLRSVWVYIGSGDGSALRSAEVDSTLTNQYGHYRFVVAPGLYEVWRDSIYGDTYSIDVTDAPVDGKNFDVITDVREIESPDLPNSYSLAQNYPNPFNPQTQVEFTIPRASFVEIHIYNILGKRLRTLVSERLSAGRKVVTWDGTDDRGMPVSSGVYFYQIRAEGFAEARKMLLLK